MNYSSKILVHSIFFAFLHHGCHVQAMSLAKPQDSLQLYEVSLNNDTNLALSVVDEIDGPMGVQQKSFMLQSKQVYSYSWPQDTGPIWTRKIVIQGSCQGISGRTNAIVIGNTRDATFMPGGGTPGGLYVITQPSACLLTVWQKPGHHTDPILFPKASQIWEVIIENKTLIDLWVVDEILTPERVFRRVDYIIQKGSQLTIQQPSDITFAKTRRIAIQGSCHGVSQKTNLIVIGNTQDATLVPLGGSPSGNYVITQKGCIIAVVPTTWVSSR